ncbi:MAG TPA: hypothetical protein VFE25_02425 [Opitutaceae bacterium]|nr:hypothetical protein [Opitutaceae bacterium]
MLDSYTRDLLTNDEVLAVNRDSLGKQGVRVAGNHKHHVIVKLLADKSLAVG